MKNETPAEAETVIEQDRQQTNGKKKRWPVIAAVLAVLVLGVVLWFTLGNRKTSSYQPAARLSDEVGQLTVEFFQKPVQQTGDMPYLAFSYDTSVEMDNGQTFWFYTYHFRETNGHPFRIKSAVAYSFPPSNRFTDAFPAERLAEYGIAAEIRLMGSGRLAADFLFSPIAA